MRISFKARGGRSFLAQGFFAGSRQAQLTGLDPFQGFVQMAESHRLVGGPHHAGFLEEPLHLQTAGQTLGDIAEDQIAVMFLQPVLDLLQNMGGGDVQGLHPAHGENDVAPLVAFRLQSLKQLVGGAEEQAALKLEDHGVGTFAGQKLHVLARTRALGEHLGAVDTVAHHRAAGLLADEQQDRQSHARRPTRRSDCRTGPPESPPESPESRSGSRG